ncbi:MAG TPA: DNA-processing protein DprA [Gemmatimonadales bacterium]|nr:DNA-processing protein DprA [Gemmatimonadales bacterium]
MADAAPSGRDPDELAAYLAIAELPGIGPARLRTLIAAFEGARPALSAPHGAIAALPGWSRAAASAIRRLSLDKGRTILAALAQLGATVLTPDDPRFPPLLREIPEAPQWLYAWGDLSLLLRRAAAMVGSRDHTSYGANAAELLARGVARHAVVVVSGMARGIDAIAHSATLDAGGGSVGVLGNGFGVVYPASNKELYQRMINRGCLITELPPGEKPHAGAFPRRNRLVSGLAGATVIVEAAPGSGALITADCALDQGRQVLAVPGPITSPTSLGCNRLIQQGAKPALCAADILEELGIAAAHAENTPAPSARPAGTIPADCTPLQRALWEALEPEPLHVDALATGLAAGLTVATSDVLTALTELELRGLVKQQPGMMFERQG